MIKDNYGFALKFLHTLVLGNKFIPELLFDIENIITKKKKESLKDYNQVFITGLARAGTTILLQALHKSGEFASYTYRDMPFTICPNLWNIFSKYLKNKKSIKRAHTDNLFIDLDSPEQFEEIFWNLKNSSDYNLKKYLKSYNVDDYTLELYEKFIKNCLIKYKKKNYLCKNNNNLLRINSLIKKFPKAKFVIVYRNPLDHATSLLNQQKHFSKIQSKNKFYKKYMNYLVHHEFGLNQKPMLFENNFLSNFDNDNLNYWLDQWINYYQFVYDNLCKHNNILVINFGTNNHDNDINLKKITKFLGVNYFKDLPKNFFSFKSYNETHYKFDEKLKNISLNIFENLDNSL